MTAVASAFGADRVGDVQALTDGFSAGLVGAAGLAAAGAVLAAVTLRSTNPRAGQSSVPEGSCRGELSQRAGAPRARRPGARRRRGACRRIGPSGIMGSPEDRRAVEELGFRLLGPMEITVDGRPASLPGAAERALLAQLLLSPGRTIPATTLVDRLWAESALPVDPMNALQVRVSKLRRALAALGAPDLVAREGVGYRASVAPESVDAVDFVARVRRARAAGSATDDPVVESHLQAYDDALGLWRGEALSDFTTEAWATAEAVRLAELRLAALTERAQIALALDRPLEVVADLEPIVAADPTLESLAGLLMVALYRSGRQADALDVFTRTRVTLDESSVSSRRRRCAPSTNGCCARSCHSALSPTRRRPSPRLAVAAPPGPGPRRPTCRRACAT